MKYLPLVLPDDEEIIGSFEFKDYSKNYVFTTLKKNNKL